MRGGLLPWFGCGRWRHLSWRRGERFSFLVLPGTGTANTRGRHTGLLSGPCELYSNSLLTGYNTAPGNPREFNRTRKFIVSFMYPSQPPPYNAESQPFYVQVAGVNFAVARQEIRRRLMRHVETQTRQHRAQRCRRADP